tara:strand:+ start:10132 stop:11343 length:1212 start_codon:yes stop_codon:yes gene_type:complete
VDLEKVFINYKNLYEDFDSFHRSAGNLFVLLRLFQVVSWFQPIFNVFFLKPNLKLDLPSIEFIFTRNQLNSSRKLNLRSEKICVGVEEKNKQLNSPTHNISNLTLLFYGFFYAKNIYAYLVKCKGNNLLEKNSFRVIKLAILEALIVNSNSSKVKTLIQYNDHSPYNVLLHNLFSELNIRTVYCQHAPVNTSFPKLYHDINLLFSEDSLSKYREIGDINKKFEIIGDIRFWNVICEPNRNNNSKQNKILICSNELDCPTSISKCAKILAENGYDVIHRKHPADHYNFKESAYVSLSSNQNIFDDLKECDIVITNQSAVPLESIFMKKPTYLFRFKNRSGTNFVLDNYNFISGGLIKKEFKDLKELLYSIETKELTYDHKKLSYYLGPISEKPEIRKKLLTQFT